MYEAVKFVPVVQISFEFDPVGHVCLDDCCIEVSNEVVSALLSRHLEDGLLHVFRTPSADIITKGTAAAQLEEILNVVVQSNQDSLWCCVSTVVPCRRLIDDNYLVFVSFLRVDDCVLG